MKQSLLLAVSMIALAALACSAGSADRARADDIDVFTVDDIERSHLLYVPESYDGATELPLVVAMHGGGLGGPVSMANLSSFNEVADSENFFVLYPEGAGNNWNDGRDFEGRDELVARDDVTYVLTLIDALAEDYAIDSNRVFATGISNGGYMSQRLACQAPERFAAIASVAATFHDPFYDECSLGEPMPVLYILGTDDPLVSYDGGGQVGSGERGTTSTAVEGFTRWAELNNCVGTAVTSVMDDVEADDTSPFRQTYEDCDEGVTVSMITITGGGHTWPGGPQYLPAALIGETSDDFEATEIIWEFFAAAP